MTASEPQRAGPVGVSLADVASLGLLVVALLFLWLEPTTVYRCAPRGEGSAQCLISERGLGLVPLAERTLVGITRASYGRHTEQSESRNSDGRTRTTRTTVEDLVFLDAQQRELWKASESHLLGASLEDLARRVEELVSGEDPKPFVRWYVPWPVLLLATPFVLIAASHLPTRVALCLRRRGLIPNPLYQVLYWTPMLAIGALLPFAWVVAFLGASPPAWLVKGLGLS